jgi:hypothetical protein
MADLINDVINVFPDVSISFGEIQGELNTGDHDKGLLDVALTSGQLKTEEARIQLQL